MQAEWVERYRFRFRLVCQVVEAMCDLDGLDQVVGAHAYASKVKSVSEGLWWVRIDAVRAPLRDTVSLELVTYAAARAQLAASELFLFIYSVSAPTLRVRGIAGPAGQWTDIGASA